jgi:hypothetical protein
LHAQQAQQAQLAAAAAQQQAQAQNAQVQEMLMRSLRPVAPQIIHVPANVVTTGRNVAQPYQAPVGGGYGMPPVGGGGPTGMPPLQSVAPPGSLWPGSQQPAPAAVGPTRGFGSLVRQPEPLPTNSYNNNGGKSRNYFGQGGNRAPAQEQIISDTTIRTINKSFGAYAFKPEENV